jgi:hypothetical protein
MEAGILATVLEEAPTRHLPQTQPGFVPSVSTALCRVDFNQLNLEIALGRAQPSGQSTAVPVSTVSKEILIALPLSTLNVPWTAYFTK